MDYNQVRENIKTGKYNVVGGNSERDFYEDLAALFELDPKDPLTKRIYSKAWEKGHWAGQEEVLCHYHDLVEVFKG